ncbi:MAG: 30S ribosomal protein S9 [bacterium]
MTTTDSFQATGRRMTAVAHVKVISGSGNVTVNGRNFEDYFATIGQRVLALQALVLADHRKKVDVEATVHGGGNGGQAGAMRMAIARALIKLNPELRPSLKKGGMLTRDPRMKERKKSGQPGARKRFQFSKR